MNRRNAIKNISIGMGLSISAGTLMTVISSCKTEPTIDKIIDSWAPKFFTNKDQATFIENLADVIFPPTSTPGAKEAGVLKFIDEMVGEVYKPKQQGRFRKGLEQCIKSIEAEQGTTFAKLTTDQISIFLEKHIGSKSDKATYRAASKLADLEEAPTDEASQSTYYLYSFLNAMKNLTVSGYFGSELIATEHMNYLPVPGPFEGCIDYTGNDYSL
ncbi:MAG: hypothetical protein ACI8YQ_002339 [Polaribacter sp.]|jgi:hypothetical protein